MIQFLLTMLLVAPAFAHGPHRHHEAHVHGHIDIAMAFSGTDGAVDFEAPGESIYGFEHKARNAKDKARQSEALQLLETKMPEMIVFAADLGCAWTHTQTDIEQKGRHATVHSRFKVACKKSPAGSEVTFQLQNHFPRIKDAEVTLVADDVQASGKATRAGDRISWKAP